MGSERADSPQTVGKENRNGGTLSYPRQNSRRKSMPRKPKRPCSYPGCPKLVDGQYCEEHQKLVTAQYNKYGRDDFSKSFYKSPAWLLIKKRQLERQPFCEECLKNGQRKKATMVDHIVPIKQGGDKFSFSNLQSLCWACHSRKSAQEGSRWGRKPRDYGNP